MKFGMLIASDVIGRLMIRHCQRTARLPCGRSGDVLVRGQVISLWADS